MATLSELIAAGKRHQVTFTNKDGKRLLELSALWAVVIAFAAPQALLLTIVLALLELIHVELDGEQLSLEKSK